MKIVEQTERSGGHIPYKIYFDDGETVPEMGSKFDLGNGRLVAVKRIHTQTGMRTIVDGDYYRGIPELNYEVG